MTYKSQMEQHACNIGAQINDKTSGSSCFSWRMCVSSLIRMVATTNMNQAGETVVEGMYHIMLFISSFGVANGKHPLK